MVIMPSAARRGWFYEETKGEAHDRKIMLREVGRLETSLKAAGDRTKLVFLHYPPKYLAMSARTIWTLLDAYHVRCAAMDISTAAAAAAPFRVCITTRSSGCCRRIYFVLPAQDSPVKQVLILGHKSVIVFRHVLFMTNFINNAPGDK